MIDKTTVLILGAGASTAEYGLPTGAELKQRMLNLCKPTLFALFKNQQNKKRFHRFLGSIAISRKDVQEFVNSLHRSDDKSIDAFLGKHDNFQKLGKAVIAHILLTYESNLRQNHYTAWYNCLFNRMIAKCATYNEFKTSSKLMVITFNYDRTLERYLTKKLVTKYGKTADAIENDMQEIFLINHVHGQSYPLTDNSCSIDSISEKNYIDIMCLAMGQIVLIYEAESDKDQFNKIAKEYQNAERIIFLGFGFDEDNSEHLGLDNIKPNTPIYALAYDDETKAKAKRALCTHNVTFSNAKENITDFIMRSGCL